MNEWMGRSEKKLEVVWGWVVHTLSFYLLENNEGTPLYAVDTNTGQEVLEMLSEIRGEQKDTSRKSIEIESKYFTSVVTQLQ